MRKLKIFGKSFEKRYRNFFSYPKTKVKSPPMCAPPNSVHL